MALAYSRAVAGRKGTLCLASSPIRHQLHHASPIIPIVVGNARCVGRRNFLSCFHPPPLPPDEVLSRARNAADDLGFQPLEVYEPWLPVDFGQQVLMHLHSFCGNSGLTVAVVAILLRLVTLPMNKRAMQKMCDRMELMPVYMNIARGLQQAQVRRMNASKGNTEVATQAREALEAEVAVRKYSLMLNDFTKETNFSVMQGMGYQFGVLMPMYIMGYFTLRGIVAHPDAFRGFVVEPTLWLDSLVLPDPLGLLPAVSALIILLNVEVNSPVVKSMTPAQLENAQYMRLVIRGVALTFAPVTTLLPSAILVFMATNAAYTVFSTWIYRNYFWKRPELKPHWLTDVEKLTKR